MEKGLSIIDHLNLLSKNQKHRLKTIIKPHLSEKIFTSIDSKLKFNKYMNHEILPSIHYQEECGNKYNHFELYLDNTNKNYVIEFLFQDKENSRQKIKQLVREKQICRKSSGTDNKTDIWKSYIHLKNISQRTDIPSPEDISKNSSTYEELIKNIPHSPLKTYIEKCLLDVSK